MTITGVKKAYEDYKKWTSRPFRCANIMLNRKTGSVWTDCFMDENNWKVYHDDNIISLLQYIRERTCEAISKDVLLKYAEEAILQEDDC